MKTATPVRKTVAAVGFCLTALICTPLDSFANILPAITAHVTGAGTYSDGSIYVLFDRQISSCTPEGRLDIAVGHPALKNILAVAMIAFASGRAVRIHPGSCNGTTPVFTLTGDSYFYLTTDNP